MFLILDSKELKSFSFNLRTALARWRQLQLKEQGKLHIVIII